MLAQGCLLCERGSSLGTGAKVPMAHMHGLGFLDPCWRSPGLKAKLPYRS